MKLNKFEFKLLTGKLRCWIQQYFDIRQWRKQGANNCVGGVALDIGCGQGYGIRLAKNKFACRQVDAFDVDDRMINLSLRATENISNVKITHGSATDIQAAANTYDVAFDYQVLHHIQDWQSAVSEIHRVLKPSAQLMVAESLPGLIERSWWGSKMSHPQGNRFTAQQLCDELQSAGFTLSKSRTIGDYFIWLVATKD
ncbi:MAG: class I SAM-dependent methyltransferase [Planctomycetes bacterium]|nr:class I SAM-dependent methyltransferase [Planctomycetota bacterium]